MLGQNLGLAGGEFTPSPGGRFDDAAGDLKGSDSGRG